MRLAAGHSGAVSVIPADVSRSTRRWRRRFPRGRVIEIYGPESGGKTTMTLHVIAEAQKLAAAAFIDAEHALDPVYARSWAWTWTIAGIAAGQGEQRWKSRKR